MVSQIEAVFEQNEVCDGKELLSVFWLDFEQNEDARKAYKPRILEKRFGCRLLCANRKRLQILRSD